MNPLYLRQRMTRYLTHYCSFQRRTIRLLDCENIAKLAREYGFRE